jgi:hypothetical protein
MTILMNKKYFLFAVLLILSAKLFSQGPVESVLTSNSVLIQKYNELQQKSLYRSGGSITDTLILGTKGFRDDFSYEGPYPDTALWLNNYVFVNRDLPIAPITIGVATFDGVNANGYPYNFSAGAGTTGKADSLTSKPIDLYYPGDTSVYFSFFYQAGGRGDYPFTYDSLVLEFKDPTVSVASPWKHVWSTKGLSSSPSDSSWKYISIHITNPGFLNKGFQFRFSNYATLSGTFDNWHLDYVYLNRNRTANDSVTIVQDVSFVYNTPALINTYTVMPWRHYNPSFLKGNYSTTIRNNNNAVVFGGFGYTVYDQNNISVANYNGGAINYEKFSAVGYDTLSATKKPPLATSPVNFLIPPLTGRTKYRIESFLTASPDFIVENDTVSHIQDFNNYFSYDDGTAETSFGLAGYLHAQIALKYTLTVADTLRCIDIYFNPQLTNGSLYTFALKVWSATGSGAPGTAIFTSVDSLYRPYYNQGGHNYFTRYYLESPVYLSAGATFFIGMDQNTTQPINIGVDKNTNAQNMAYYNTSGSWQHPPLAGTLMMHPVLGQPAEVVGINNKEVKSKFIVYPNPANDLLFLYSETYSGPENISFRITDISGRVVLENKINSSGPVEVSSLSNGVYFISIKAGDTFSTHKFIISR